MKSTLNAGRLMVMTSVFLMAIAASAQSQPGLGRPDVLTLELDPAKTYQTMVGFGASDAWRLQMVGNYWPEAKKHRIADLLFSSRVSADGKPEGIGLSLWRFYIGAGSMEQGEESGIADEWRRAECFQKPDGSYDWSKQAGQRWFLRAAQARGVSNFLAFSIAPPAHLALNGKAHGFTNTLNLRAGKLGDYAKFLVDVLEHFEKQEKVPFQYLSPVNEPQWNWASGNNQEGTALSNAEGYEFVRLIGEELNHRKLATRIVFGEAAQIPYLYSANNLPGRSDQIRAFLDKRSKLFIGGIPNVANIISGHSYGTTWPIEVLVSNRMTLRLTLDQVSPETEYWQSEFCIMEKTDEFAGGWKRDLGMATALHVARVIHADLTLANAASWQWWTAVTRCDYKDGLIYLDDGGSVGMRSARPEYVKRDGEIRTSKLLWAFGNYSLFVRPGMVRIRAGFLNRNQTPVEEARDLMVSAYEDKRTGIRVVVFVNCGKERRTVAISEGRRVEVFITDETSDLQRQAATPGVIEIPRRSVVTAVLGAHQK